MATAEQFLAAARAELGYTETPTNKTKFAAEAGHANGQPWCATFCVAIGRRVGLTLGNESAYTPSLYGSMAHASEPKPGDLVFFNWPGDGVNRIQHVGIVAAVNSTSIATIEGNAQPDNQGNQSDGGGVRARKRARDSSIVGYGRPTFITPQAPQERKPFMAMTDDEQRELLQRVRDLHGWAASGTVERIAKMLEKHVADPSTGGGAGGIDRATLEAELRDELSKLTIKLG